jgi:integrase
MTTSFYIREHSNSNSASIYVRVNEGRYKQFRFATGNDLNKASSWNDNTQSVRTNSIEPFDILNLQLRRLKAHIEAEYVHAKSKGIPRSKRFYKTTLSNFQLSEMKVNSEHKLLSLGDAFEMYIEDAKANRNGIKIAPSTVKVITNSYNHTKYLRMHTILLSELDIDWYYEFVERSEQSGRNGEPLSMNYISTQIKKIKRVLRYAEDSGHCVHSAYKSSSFKAPQETASEIYLNEEELSQIRAQELHSEQYSLALTRDLFMIGAYSGLRVSDYNRLTNDNLHSHNGSEMLEVRCQKTKSVVVIPLHQVTKSILKKYDGSLPPSQNEQVMNRDLKALGRLCGIDGDIVVETTKGGRMTSYKRLKYEMIKTHTARRSFCTNAYLLGMDSLDIMALSGHKTEANFLKYIKVTGKERAKRIAEHEFFQ